MVLEPRSTALPPSHPTLPAPGAQVNWEPAGFKKRRGERRKKVFQQSAKLAANTTRGTRNCIPTLEANLAAWQHRKYLLTLPLEAYALENF